MGAEHTFFFEGILLRDKTLYKTNGKQDILSPQNWPNFMEKVKFYKSMVGSIWRAETAMIPQPLV